MRGGLGRLPPRGEHERPRKGIRCLAAAQPVASGPYDLPRLDKSRGRRDGGGEPSDGLARTGRVADGSLAGTERPCRHFGWARTKAGSGGLGDGGDVGEDAGELRLGAGAAAAWSVARWGDLYRGCHHLGRGLQNGRVSIDDRESACRRSQTCSLPRWKHLPAPASPPPPTKKQLDRDSSLSACCRQQTSAKCCKTDSRGRARSADESS